MNPDKEKIEKKKNNDPTIHNTVTRGVFKRDTRARTFFFLQFRGNLTKHKPHNFQKPSLIFFIFSTVFVNPNFFHNHDKTKAIYEAI